MLVCAVDRLNSAVSIDSQQKSMFLGPCLNSSSSAIKTTLSMRPLGDDRVAGERADGYLSTWLLKSSFGEHSCGSEIYSCFFVHERHSCMSITQILLLPVFQMCSFQVPDQWPRIMVCDSVCNHMYVHFFFLVKWITMSCAQFSVHWKDFPSTLPFSGISHKGAETQLSISKVVLA